jgi:hypothetical protein
MKKTISRIMLITLLMTVLMAIAPAEGQINESSKIRFKAFAAGKCFISYGEGPGWPEPWLWYGIGKGSARISGCAEDIESLGDFYVSENIKAWGFISLSWKEDGSKHWLLAVLYSDTSTTGAFFPDDDFFAMGIEAQPPLRFIGVYASGSEIQRISGTAAFAVVRLEPPPHYLVMVAYLFDEYSQILYAPGWVPEDTEMTDPTIPPILVPAARVFWRNVEVVSSP